MFGRQPIANLAFIYDHKLDFVLANTLHQKLRIAAGRKPHHFESTVVVDHVELPCHDYSTRSMIVNPLCTHDVGVRRLLRQIESQIVTTNADLLGYARSDQDSYRNYARNRYNSQKSLSHDP